MRVVCLLCGLLAIFILVACGRNESDTEPALAATTPSATNTFLPQPGDTPTPAPETLAVIAVNLNVRQGPGTEFAKVGLLIANSEVFITGKNSEGSWWQINYPDAPEGVGWIAAEFARASHTDSIPVVSESAPIAAALPAATPSAPASITPGFTVTTTSPPRQLTLEINPDTIHATECARIRYHIEQLTGLTINGNPLATSGRSNSVIVCPELNTTYTISGLDSLGRTISQAVRLRVIPSTPTPQPSSGSVLVAMTRGCQFALTTLGTTSSELCRFSPDGQKVAVPAGDGSLWVISAGGDSFEEVFNPGGRFVIAGDLLWSPNGEYIAFSATGLDGIEVGVGYYRLASRTLAYLGPDARLGKSEAAAWPRWTQDGRLIITWFESGRDKPGTVSVFGPLIYAPDGPVPLEAGTELMFSAGVVGQQLHPWKPGKLWRVGDRPSYEVDF